MELLKWLTKKSVVDIDIVELRQYDDVVYLKCTVVFEDKSELHVRQYIDEFHRKYSFHWQKSDGNLIVRWDNAPHHPQLISFPHHKHELTEDNVLVSVEITLEEVMDYIVNQF